MHSVGCAQQEKKLGRKLKTFPTHNLGVWETFTNKTYVYNN